MFPATGCTSFVRFVFVIEVDNEVEVDNEERNVGKAGGTGNELANGVGPADSDS